MATPVTVTTYYRDDDYFNAKNAPVYIYAGSSGSGTPVSPLNFYTKTELLTDGVLDARYYTETELDAGQLDNRYYTETESDARYLETAGDILEGDLSLLDNAGSISFGDAALGLSIQSDGSYLRYDRGVSTAGLNFYITSEIPNTYIYSPTIYLGYTTGTTVEYRGNALSGDDWGLSAAGVLSIEEIVSKDVTYSSGFTGTGWTIYDKGSNEYKAEFDELIVRGSMSVYEFIVNKIRATNGSLWVTDSVVALSDLTFYSIGVYYFTVEPGNNTLSVGDKIKGQTFTGRSVKSYEYTVVSISTDRTQIRVSGATATDETKDMPFVRVGNTSDTSRQGALYLTSSDVNSPYLEVLDGMTTHTIAQEDRKVRLGNLAGITYDGDALGGYGLWSDAVYLEGKIVATEGDIGSWNIAGGNLYSDTGTGDITLDADAAEIVIKDATDDIKVLIGKSSIPSWSGAFGGSSKNFTGSFADTYTDVSQVITTNNSDNDTWYLQEYSTSSYLDMFTSNQGVTRHIPIDSDNPYAVVLKWDTTISYPALPADDTDETDGETHTYALGGSYSQTITVKAYTSAGTLIATQVNTYNNRTESLADITIFSKTVRTDDDYVYYTIQVETTNSLAVEDTATYWQWTGSEWIEVYTVVNNTSMSTTFNMQVEELTQEGNVNQVNIGNNGFMHWSDSDKYFHLNEDEGTYYIHSNGPWRHYYGMRIGAVSASDPNYPTTIYYHQDGTVSGSMTNAALNVNTNRSGYALNVYNDGNNANRAGILIQSGEDTPTANDCIAIRFQTGSGTYKGSIYWESAGIYLYHNSDMKLKKDIKSKEMDGLGILRQIDLKSWKWLQRDDKGKLTNEAYETETEGYIADDVELIYPDAVRTDAETGDKVISEMKFIRPMQKAILQLSQQITDLQDQLEKIKIK